MYSMRPIFYFLLICFSHSIGLSQNQGMLIPVVPDDEKRINVGSPLFTSPSEGSLFPKDIKEDWNISLKHFSTYYHNSELPLEEYKRLKEEANEVRNNPVEEHRDELSAKTSQELTPVLLNNFRGNIRGNSIPMDNTMAVSRNGFVVSAINSSIIFTMPDGKVTFNRGFADFYKILALGTRMFDPRVIYDPEQNRFIVVCLHGSEPSTSYLCIAFSQTEDPNGEWNFYKIKGNPLADDVWFDFPNIGVSKEDLYIAGNMFTAEGGYRYSMIFQISKMDGYKGDDLTWKFYDRVSSVSGNLVFNPVPAMSGWETLTTPGMYFISNGNNNYNLNYTNESVKNNPSLISLRAQGESNSYPPEGRQKNTKVLLNTGGNRIRTAMFQDNVLHFASQSNSPSGDGGLFYGRLKIADLKVFSNVLVVPDRDYAYPTITSYGDKESDGEVLINYTYTGPDVFPGQAARVVKGNNEDFIWSEEAILKEGQSAIGNNTDESIRWGDYTGACRRFGVNRKESWGVGTYGDNQGHSTWIGQFIAQDDMVNPVMEITASITTTRIDSIVTFRDIGNVTPVSRKWIFEGGSPSESNDELPSVTYSANGAYDVTLIADYGTKIDTFTKKDFIYILDPVLKPEAIWIYDKDTIYVGDTVQFTSMSSANTLTHKWTFSSGTPSTSTEETPVVTYKKKGSFLVSLTVANNAGTNTAILNKAVTVFDRSAPTAAFSVSKEAILVGDSVVFTDKSSGAKSVSWIFSGGIPETSTLRLPEVTYPVSGSYPVKLVVKNDYGLDSLIQESYINVGVSSTENEAAADDFRIYPNPVVAGNTDVTIAFNNNKTGNYKIDLYDLNGRIIKTLYHDKIKFGRNELYFRTSNLSSGNYYIVLSSDNTQHKVLQLLISE